MCLRVNIFFKNFLQYIRIAYTQNWKCYWSPTLLIKNERLPIFRRVKNILKHRTYENKI